MFTIEYTLKRDQYNTPVRSYAIKSIKDLAVELRDLRRPHTFAGRGTYRRWKITRDADGVVIAQWHSK